MSLSFQKFKSVAFHNAVKKNLNPVKHIRGLSMAIFIFKYFQHNEFATFYIKCMSKGLLYVASRKSLQSVYNYN